MIYMYFILAAVLFAVGLQYFILWATWDYSADFLHLERCTNDGGIWDNTIDRCWYAGECEDMHGFWYPAEKRCVLEDDIMMQS